MYIRFDYVCNGCNEQEERFVKKEDKDIQMHQCDENTQRMMSRLMSAPVTTFRFNDRKLKP